MRNRPMQNKMLDRLYQQTVIELNKGQSLLGGKAEVAHHFYHRWKGLALRYWLPNSVLLTHEQHLEIHSKNRKEIEQQIIKIKGKEWKYNLERRQNLVVKNLDPKKVIMYLEGKLSDYIL